MQKLIRLNLKKSEFIMPRVKANNIEIEYDTFGDPSSKPLLLIMGLGAQMIRWEVEFCEQFAERGFHVLDSTIEM